MIDNRQRPAQYRVLSYVIQYPGCTKWEVSVATGPHGSNKYGYAAVQRAIRNGLIEAVFDGRRYHLYAAK